jgi:glycolate oxidase iron-sulfur subunit
MSQKIPFEALPAALRRDADLCVKCGLCLPHCPTYRVTLDEAESPRGRIALMQGLAGGTLPAGAALQAHLDGCLVCRACEAVCPAGVPYGRLIDDARELLASEHPARSRLERVLAAVLSRKPLRALAALLLVLYRRMGVQRAVRGLRLLGRGRLARLESLLPPVHLPRQPRDAAPGPAPLALFGNCISPLAEPGVLDDAVAVLGALGERVAVPRAQTCCGALHRHAGLAEGAGRCARRNISAFAGAGQVLGVASGCTAQLAEYDRVLDDPAAGAFARKVRDIHAFVAAHPRLASLRLAPLRARVLLHTPCTLRNVLQGAAPVRALLARIEGLELQEMDAACCGAAGSYFISRPEMADRLLEDKLDLAAQAGPDYVVSSNVGCALHLAAGLRRRGITAAVVHPLRLLAQQLDRP